TSDGFTAANDGKQAIQRLMNPAFSAMSFYGAGNTTNRGLMDVPGWEGMRPTQAAQTVQGSAFPEAYAKWEGQAQDLYNKNKDAPKVDPGKGGGSSSGSKDSKDSKSSDTNTETVSNKK